MSNVSISAYPGSKNHLADKYTELLPVNGIKTYAEPFSGMFAVGIHCSPTVYSIRIYNDINPKLALLAKVLSNPDTANRLFDMMLEVKFSKESFNYAKKVSASAKNIDIDCDINEEAMETACAVWVTLLLSYNGSMQTFRKLRKGTDEESYIKMIKNKLPLIELMDGIQVCNKNGFDLIAELKHKRDTFLFVDPPYNENSNCGEKSDIKHIRNDRTYEFDMAEEAKQKQFLDTVKDATAKTLICSYDNELYNEILCSKCGWEKLAVADTYKFMRVGFKGERKVKVTEYAYVNYDYNRG